MLIKENTARLSIGSQTNAQRARSELKAKGYYSRIVKIETRLKDGGCLFGLEIKKDDAVTCIRLLYDAGIYAKETE